MALKYQHAILLLDDEKSITSALQRLFHRENYRILTASSGQEAIALMKQQERPISLIISDQRMPGMNGSQFLEVARSLSPNTIRFLLTGYSDMEAIVDAVNKGEIHRYLTKPWNDRDLVLQVLSINPFCFLKLSSSQRIDHTDEDLVGLKRLDDIPIDAEFQGSLRDLWVIHPGEHDHSNIRAGLQGMADEIKPRFPGHPDVTKDKIETVFL